MSVNKLNLQIGGSREPEEDTLLEETGVSIEVDDLIADLFDDNKEEIVEEHGDFLVKALDNAMPERVVVAEPELPEEWLPEPLVEEVQQEEVALTREERMAEAMSLYHKKSLSEVAPVSDTDRIKLLEDAFAQMKRGQPQTLVTGIGASLDSGGGAVWLWDLEDINIGAPYQNTTTGGTSYPDIPDGSILTFDKSKSYWVPVEGTGEATNILTGGIIKATGGAANTSGNLVIQATDGTNGDLIIQDSSEDVKFRVDGNNGVTTLSGGKLTITRATSGSNLNIQGKTVLFPQDATSLLLGTNAASGNNSDSIRYYGTVTDNNDIANKKYVDDSIAGLDPSGGFTFKGTCDVTRSVTSDPPNPASAANPSAGDFYINTVAGVANSSWTGIGELTISADQLIIYSGSSARWFAGAVEGANPNVLKAGDTMTGSLTIDPESGTNALIIRSGGTTTAQIFSGGSATFNNTLTAYNANFNNVKPRQDNTWSLGSNTSTWNHGYINNITSTTVDNSGTLDVSGTCTVAKSSSGTRFVVGNSSMVGSSADPSYFFNGGKSANLIIGRCTDNSMSNPQIIIQGKTDASDGVKTNDLLQVFRISGNAPDAIRYFGRTSSSNDIQNKKSCDQTYARLASSNDFANSQSIKVDNGQFALTVEPSNSTTDTFRVYGSGKVETTQISQTSASLNNDFKGPITSEGPFVTTGTVNFVRSGTTSSSDWMIQGRTTGAPTRDDGQLLVVSRSTGSSGSDNISYEGGTGGLGNIQTKSSVQALINSSVDAAVAASVSAWTTIDSTTSNQSISTMSGTGWFIKYRTTNSGKTVEVIAHAAKGGTRVVAGDILGVLPTALQPAYQVPVLFSPKNATTTLDQGTGALGLVSTTGAIAVIYCFSNTGDSNASGTGSQDYWANFSYALNS